MACPADGDFEGAQIDFAKCALVDLGVDRHPFEFGLVAREMFDRSRDAGILQARNVSRTELTGQPGIFRETLEVSTP